MQTSIMQDMRSFLRSGNMVTKLIIVNLIFTVALFLVNIFFGHSSAFGGITKYFLFSDNTVWNIKHPWVIITHLFISNNLIDLIWNMVILYWFGAIVGDMIGDDKILPLYIMGGIFGSLVYFLFMNISGIAGFRFISGCNTAVLAVTVASAVLVPNYNVRLIIFGNVPLKFIVIVYVLLQLIYAYTGYNDVLYALIGAVFFGWIYIRSIGKSWRLDKMFNNTLEKIKRFFSFSMKYKQNKNLSVKYKSKGAYFEKKSKDKAEFDEKLDDILKKIKDSGYESLTEAEKEFLFLASKD